MVLLPKQVSTITSKMCFRQWHCQKHIIGPLYCLFIIRQVSCENSRPTEYTVGAYKIRNCNHSQKSAMGSFTSEILHFWAPLIHYSPHRVKFHTQWCAIQSILC